MPGSENESSFARDEVANFEHAFERTVESDTHGADNHAAEPYVEEGGDGEGTPPLHFSLGGPPSAVHAATANPAAAPVKRKMPPWLIPVVGGVITLGVLVAVRGFPGGQNSQPQVDQARIAAALAAQQQVAPQQIQDPAQAPVAAPPQAAQGGQVSSGALPPATSAAVLPAAPAVAEDLAARDRIQILEQKIAALEQSVSAAAAAMNAKASPPAKVVTAPKASSAARTEKALVQKTAAKTDKAAPKGKDKVAPAPLTGYYLHLVVPGQAWIVNAEGQRAVVNAGDSVAGVKIRKIDDAKAQVELEDGRLIRPRS